MSNELAEPDLDDFWNPEQEQAEAGKNVPPADELALEEINPLNAHLFRDHSWQGHFERLRRKTRFILMSCNRLADIGRSQSTKTSRR